MQKIVHNVHVRFVLIFLVSIIWSQPAEAGAVKRELERLRVMDKVLRLLERPFTDAEGGFAAPDREQEPVPYHLLPADKRKRYKAQNNRDPLIKIRFDGATGYRQDKLRWNIAGDMSGCCPDILSELTWSDLSAYELKGSIDVLVANRFRMETKGAIGFIGSGENQDSDYLLSGRNLEFSRSNNNAGGGELIDYSLGGGYQFDLGDIRHVANEAQIGVLGGYSWHRQNLEITEGYQTIDLINGYIGPIPGVNSTYETEWDGPWLGFELSGQNRRITGVLRFEYHWADYVGIGNWNLRDDFAHPISFQHTAEGTGYVTRLDFGYDFTEQWNLGAQLDFQAWETKGGVDRTFFADGTHLDTRFNEAIWDSFSLGLRLSYSF